MTLSGAPPVLVVAGAVLDDLSAPQRLLAARRAQPVSLAGRWEFPGGKVEPGEDPLTALHRELREELGVTIRIGEEVVGHEPHGWRLSDRYIMRLWTVQVTGGAAPAPLVEHDELRWLGLGDWLSVPWLDADVPIVRELERLVGRP